MEHENRREINSYVSVLLTQPTFPYSLIAKDVWWTTTHVTSFGVDARSTRMTGVPPLDRLVVAFVDIDTLRTLGTIVETDPVAWFATTVVPTGHIDTRRCFVTIIHVARALVEIHFAAVAGVTTPARTLSWHRAFATILTDLIADG